jgi:alkylation response protein AidB-like acyl-CoA dehydrogenase
MTSKPPDFADTCREVMARLDAARTLLSSTVTDDLNRAQILRRGLALANIKGARRALDIATEA